MSELNKLKSLVASGQMSRREFMGYATALGITVASASMLYSSAARAAPQRGGTVTIGHAHGSTTDSLDPGTYENDFTIELAFACNNYLTEVDVDGSIKGELAEEWQASDDASEWTFRLRDGLTFHDGRAVTAADVVASFNHHRGAESTSAAKPIVEPITEIKADGNNAVVITLNGGNADFPFLVSDYHIPIKPAMDDGIDWQSGIGCGPYALKEHDFGVSASFERHDGYWKNDRAWFDAIEYLAVIDPTARANALVTGQVDVISRPDLATVSLMERRPGISVEEMSGTAHYGLPMHVDVAPFDDNNVRLALKYAIDREECVSKILKGRGVVGNDHPVGRSNRYIATEEELPQKAYDPDRARHYLQQSGLSELSVSIHVSDAAFGGCVDTAQLYRESAAAAGIDINVVREPDDGYWSNVWLVKPWCGTYWGGRPTEDWMFSTAYDAEAEWNETHFNHPRFQELLVAARSELNEAVRREMYVEMQVITSDEGGALIPMYNNYVWARSDKLAHGEQMAANWDLDGHKWQERWWREG
jgi:peptide/nickel transport system substrate-binding protein